jgi:hypothetical protein
MGHAGQLASWSDWAKRQERILSNLNRFFLEFAKALEIYTRRFRKNFDVGIFPKFF